MGKVVQIEMKKQIVVLLIFLLFAALLPREAYAFYQTKLKGICVHGEDLVSEGIEKSLTKISSFGYNSIFFIAKTPDGKVYYKSKDLPLYVDVFGDVVKEAHKLNIKVYVYFPVIMDKNYATKYSKEKMVNIGNSSNDYYVSLLSENYIKYLKGFISELLQYDVDGILFDYIRFPNGSYDFSDIFIKLGESNGINMPKVKDLTYKTFVKPADWKTLFVSYEQGDSDVVKWVNLRESVVRNVSEVLTEYAKSIKPNLAIGAFTVSRGYRFEKIEGAPNIADALPYQLVNFAQYPTVFKGILDFIAPMVYLSNLKEKPDYAEVVSKEIKLLLGEDFKVYVAVNPDSISVQDTEKELYYSYKNADGVILFRYPLFQMARIEPAEISPELGKIIEVNIISSDGGSRKVNFDFKENSFIPDTQKWIILSPFYDYSAISLIIGEKQYTVNGEKKDMDVAPFILDSRTFVPIRFVAEALGSSVGWDNARKEVKITGNVQIILKIGSKQFFVDGTPFDMNVAPFIQDSRTFVPIRFVGEALGSSVGWDSSTKNITVQCFRRLD